MHVELSTRKDEKLNHLALIHVESSTLKDEKFNHLALMHRIICAPEIKC